MRVRAVMDISLVSLSLLRSAGNRKAAGLSARHRVMGLGQAMGALDFSRQSIDMRAKAMSAISDSTTLSCPAKAGHPVTTGIEVALEALGFTGSPRSNRAMTLRSKHVFVVASQIRFGGWNEEA
jgi:hypothetical protein